MVLVGHNLTLANLGVLQRLQHFAVTSTDPGKCPKVVLTLTDAEAFLISHVVSLGLPTVEATHCKCYNHS